MRASGCQKLYGYRFRLSACIFLALSWADISSIAAAQIPDPPALSSPAGERFALDRYTGRPLLVNFWATWCLPCRIEMPDLDELQSHFDAEQFTVLGIAADEADAVIDYLETLPVSYPIYAGDPDQVFAWSEQLGNRVLGLPFSALIDRTGTVRWVKMGGRISVEEMQPLVDELLEENPTLGEVL